MQQRETRQAPFRRKPGDAWAGITSTPTFKNAESLVSAIVNQDKAYILPRPAGTHVSPHQVSFNINYSISTSDIAGQKGERSMIFKPDLNELVSIGNSSAGNFADGINEFIPIEKNEYVSNTRYYFSTPIATSVYGEYMKSVTLSEVGSSPPTSGLIVSHDPHNGFTRYTPGVCSYPFKLSVANTITYSVEAVNGLDAYTLTVGMGCLNNQGSVIAEVTNTAAVGAGAAGSVAITAAAGWAAYAASQATSVATYIWFSYSKDGASKAFGIDLDSSIYTTPVAYTRYSLWNSVNPSVALKAQYLGADLWNPTGMRVLVQNVTADAAHAGTVLGARLPAYSAHRIPGDMEGIAALISTQKHHKLDQNLLAEGVCYFYTPEKIQDYFFQPPETPLNVPLGLAYFKPGDLLGAGCNLLINVTISYELITTDVSATVFPSASSEVLMNSLLYALSKENGWSENPGHLKHAAKVVKNVMTSDEMKYALKALVSTGVKIAPMVLSMLA